jgi:hypothetical protein
MEPTDSKSLYKWANCLVQLAKHECDASKMFALLDSAFEKYRKARDSHDIEWKVFYNWGNALLEKVNLMMKLKSRSIASATRNSLNTLEENADDNDDETKITYMTIFDEACSKYEAAFKLNPESAEVLLNWAVALSKKARNIPRNDPRFNSEAVSDECFEKAMQKFRAAAALKPDSWEIHFDWGNIYYRQAFMKIEQYIKRLRSAHNNNEQRKQSSIDCNQSEEKKITKSEVNTLLAKAARKYRKTIELKPKFYQTLCNWVKVLLLMDRVENLFDVDLQNNIVDVSHLESDNETETDIDADSENTQDEDATDSDYNTDSPRTSQRTVAECDVCVKDKTEHQKKSNSGELLFSQDSDNWSISSDRKLLDSFLISQVKFFLKTYSDLFLQDPRSLSLEILWDLVELKNMEITDLLFMTLKDLESFVMHTPHSSQTPSFDSEGSSVTSNISTQRRDEYQRLFRRIEKDLEEWALTQCLSNSTTNQLTFPTPPSRSGSFNNLLLVIPKSIGNNDKTNDSNNQHHATKEQTTDSVNKQNAAHSQEDKILQLGKEKTPFFPLKTVKTSSDLKALLRTFTSGQIQSQHSSEEPRNSIPTFEAFGESSFQDFRCLTKTKTSSSFEHTTTNNKNNKYLEQNKGGIRSDTVTRGSRQLSTYLRHDTRLEATRIIPVEFDLIKMLETEYSSMVAHVKKKESNSSKEEFALKIVPKAQVEDNILSRLYNNNINLTNYQMQCESEVLNKLSHPFLVKRVTSWTTEKFYYYLFEYIRNARNLDQCLLDHCSLHLLHNPKSSPSEHATSNKKSDHNRSYHLDRGIELSCCRFLGAELLLALTYLHSQRVTFKGALRPSKILIDENGHIKLIPPYTLKEKPISFEEQAQFLAPEILEGQITIGEESDWWTYGVILFLLLTGKSPFASVQLNETVQNILKGDIKFPTDIHSDAKSLIQGLLNRNVKERMEFVQKVKEHPFFKETDWEKLEKMQLISPYKPKPTLTLDISDTIVLSTTHVDDFIGYTFAENRNTKPNAHENQKQQL